MKKVLSFIILFALVFSFAGCEIDTSDDASGYSIDYTDAASFESALNGGAKVKGKTVQFYVKEYAPDSSLGINCHAGEHLNFIFENEIDVETGDTIIVRITKEPSKIFLIGSWKVPCEFIDFVAEKQENDIGTTPTTESYIEPTTPTIESNNMVGAPDDWTKLLEKHYEEVKKQFEDAGFTNIICVAHEIDYNENNTFEGSVINIAIGENGEICTFEKGEQWAKDIEIRIDYRVKPANTAPPTSNSKPSNVFYSTNDYETARKGNSGIYSYKNKGGSYDVYWIIDFDAGYVYFFTDGNGENTCDKVKLVSGDLNDRITATWHDGDDQWSWYLHFKYKNYPEILVVNDHIGFATEFTPTDLDNALSVRNTKTIKDYSKNSNSTNKTPSTSSAVGSYTHFSTGSECTFSLYIYEDGTFIWSNDDFTGLTSNGTWTQCGSSVTFEEYSIVGDEIFYYKNTYTLNSDGIQYGAWYYTRNK